MNDNTKLLIRSSVAQITENYKDCLYKSVGTYTLPSKDRVLEILSLIRRLIFPGFFKNESASDGISDFFAGNLLSDIYKLLHEQIKNAVTYTDREKKSEDYSHEEYADELCSQFISRIPNIQSLLIKDVEACFSGDPAANSKEEIIFCYPGIYAIFSYRVAHELYKLRVPFIPRIISENAHSITGIDINPGAVIGEYFFIDHGTGIVIGETTVIGDNVKLYQGVTLGALSTRGGRNLSSSKRHPTIEDNVTIYANATILGGDTVIGEGSTIGGNAFVTESVAKKSKITGKK